MLHTTLFVGIHVQLEKKAIETEQAPSAIGPYSQGMQAGNVVYTSGQLPIDPTTGDMVEGSVADRTHQTLKNLTAVIAEAGGTLNDVIKTTVYLKDISDFQEVNSVYAQYFQEPFPARSAFQVAALPLGADLEIEAIAVIK